MSGVETEKRKPGRPKKVAPEVTYTAIQSDDREAGGHCGKSEAKEAAEAAVIAHAHAVVESYAEAKDAEVPVKAPVVVAPVLRPCSLEDAPVGSKLVVSRDPEKGKVARLITPKETLELPKDDLAYTLPVNAKIRRKMPALFEASQLNADYRTLVVSSAREAIEKYREHFNPQD